MRKAPVNRRHRLVWSGVIAAVPAFALTAGVPFANRLEPRICGFPFLMAYLTVWVALAPVFLYLTHRLWIRR